MKHLNSRKRTVAARKDGARARACPSCHRNNALSQTFDRATKVAVLTCKFCNFSETRGRNAT